MCLNPEYSLHVAFDNNEYSQQRGNYGVVIEQHLAPGSDKGTEKRGNLI